MKKIIVSLLFLLNGLHFYGQSIVAGVHVATDYYYDVNPDTTLSSSCILGSVKTLPIDMNGDAIDDFTLKTRSCFGLGGGSGSISIIANNNNQVAFDYIDSCFDYSSNYLGASIMAYSYTANDLIDKNFQWSDSEITLMHSSFSGGKYGCSGNTFSASPMYLGVRIFIATDTLYGWIKVSGVEMPGISTHATASVTLEEYACNSPQTGIKEHTKQILQIFPNPVSEELHIVLPNQNKEMELLIYNSAAMLVMKKTVVPNADEIIVPAKILAAGFYYFTLSENSKTNFKGKFIISQ